MTLKEYAGIEVVASETAKVRHPRWGYNMMVPFKGASLLLLMDETYLVVCDDCGYNGLTGSDPYKTPDGPYKSIVKQSDSVMAHRNGTHLKKGPRAPYYSDEKMTVILMTFLRWRNSGVRNYAVEAARELNESGIKPYRSDKWNSGSLSNVFYSYIALDKFKIIAKAMDAVPPAVSSSSVGPARVNGSRIKYNLPEEKGNASMAKTAVASEDNHGSDSPVPILSFPTTTTGSSFVSRVKPADEEPALASVPAMRVSPAVQSAPTQALPARGDDIEILKRLADGSLLLRTDQDGKIWIATEFTGLRA